MKTLYTLLIISLLSIPMLGQGTLIDYFKVDSFTIGRIDTIVDDFGATGIFPVDYAVDVYRVLYTTPYRHIDSLVQVSQAVAVPRGTDTFTCGVPIATYFHGTTSRRTGVPSYGSSEMSLGVVLAAQGNIVSMPDYLGLGDSDTNVRVHPYVHTFSQGNTGVNAIRSTRHLIDTLNVQTNGQIFLFGYSQGGSATMACLKTIEENYPDEFDVHAAAPMSGAYDLKGAQVDLIASDSVYATPGYLPYIILGYQEVYGNLYDSIQQIMKSPWDTLIPPLFYAKTYSIGYINNQCTPVPKDMMEDSVVTAFLTDSLHPLRQALARSHLLDWAPQAPVKLLYCNGDEQVTYLNSENAYNSWTANGSPNVTKQDLGNFTHGGCIQFAMLNALGFFNTYRQGCVTNDSTTTALANTTKLKALSIYPNPATDAVTIAGASNASYHVINLIGQEVLSGKLTGANIQQLDISSLQTGSYILQIQTTDNQYLTNKLLVE